METRKVQRTGKSTFIVSLPKSWAMSNRIQPGSIIYINQGDNGALNLSTDFSERDLRTILDIGDKFGEHLARDIIGCYVGGYRKIEVTSSHLSPTQKKDLRAIVNKLIGPEIFEETNNKVIIQDLLSSEELQADQALKRIRTMCKSMIVEAISALLTNNKEMARDVIRRDNDVDRMNLLITRQFIEILRSGSVKKMAFDSITAFNYMQAASSLERIADHAAKIAEIASLHECVLPDEIKETLSRMGSILGVLIDESISVLLHGDSDKANKLIDNASDIRKQIEIMVNSSRIKDKEEMQIWLVVASSSIERMLDYIKNIGELAINLCNANMNERET